MNYVFMRYPGGKPKAATFSYDDGCQQDKRLASIFDKYGIKGTFNLNCTYARKVNITDEELHRLFLDKGHEIAVHGEFHRAPGNTRAIEGIRDVLNCRLELEERCGRIIRGMAYPDSGIRVMGNFGSYENIKRYLTDLDIVYARTLGGDNNSFKLPEDFHAWMPTAHHDNPNIMDYIDEFLAIEYPTDKSLGRGYPRLFYVWGHAYEFDAKNNWEHIEEICKRFSEASDVWLATNIEIYDYVKAYRSLVYSADGKRIYNPTLFTVWFTVDGKLHSVNSGETIVIEE